jgi:hypothetical protein
MSLWTRVRRSARGTFGPLMPNLSFLESLKSFSFGGLVFAGLGGIIYFLMIERLANYISSQTFVLFFGLLGASAQDVIQKTFRFFTPAIAKRIEFYQDLLEIAALRRGRVISDDQYGELVAARLLLRYTPLGNKLPITLESSKSNSTLSLPQ